ncbi:MAG TPA: phosphonopyruvate decarboxylase [Treponemataceae bacterium]|nr:phosphonopyruvate decarboxylase [Treponemataceae bacterium]
MIEPAFFHEQVRKNGTEFFTGVPDSLLKNLCAYITDNEPEEKHIIPANEGSAIGLATGHYLATGKTPLVYMQNSGMGNTINPLLSLVDHDVYRIPMILVIGWRGEPGVTDEPQHITQGRLTCPLLDTVGIPWIIMAEEHEELKKQFEECYHSIEKTGKPYAFVVRKNSFAPYTLKNNQPVKAELNRETAIETIMLASGNKDVFVSTTGMISRELYELREKHTMLHNHDFLTVGSMGHASQIALGIALEKQDRTVFCIDGDGATLMQMGGVAIIGAKGPKNYVHIVLNNGAHDSVGGQPTVALSIDLALVARACGYASTVSVTTKKELDIELRKEIAGPRFIEIRVTKGARKDLGRPKESPQQNKETFMQFLQK